MSKSADAFRTISEVADWLGVQPHVLRFWESKFSQVKPVKRAGGRRYYRPNDMLLLGGIRKLLHEDGLTIKGVQKVIREDGVASVAEMSPPLDEPLEQITLDAPAEELPTPNPSQPDMFAPDPVPPLSAVPDPAPEAEGAAPAENAPDTIIPDAPMVEDVPTEAGTATVTALPGFMTSRHEAATVAEDAAAPAEGADATPAPMPSSEPATEPQVADSLTPDTPETPEKTGEAAFPEGLPDFLKPDTKTAEPHTATAATDDAPGDDAPIDASSEPASEAPQARKPLIVDAPDPDEAALTGAPATLTAAIRSTRLSPAQRRTALPLVARLAAHRDRLASDPAQPSQS